ncbi:MAG: right-handed parallel beta-helix repeat-containing protein, partial [Bacteroidota bacterium]
LLPLLLLSLAPQSSFASRVLASSFGYQPTNATTAFQDAINAPFDTVIIDLQSADWWVEPSSFFNLEDKVIWFQPGVQLRALPGEFNDPFACLIRLVNAQSIEIIAYDAVLSMNQPEYLQFNDSEYRHVLSMTNCSDILIQGGTYRDSGGDGIYVGGESAFGLGYCKDVVIENVRCLNNYRQGMSITSAEDMLVRHSLFADTEGTLPEAGVDIEPYQLDQRIINLAFESCTFTRNGWAGIAVALFEMDSTSPPVSIRFSDCYLKDNHRPGNTYAPAEIFFSADEWSPVQGEVLFERCFIDGSEWSAMYSRKSADAYHVTFRDCAFQDVSRADSAFNEPIFLEVPDYAAPSPYLGGFEFDEVFISQARDVPFFRIYGWSTLPGIQDLQGSFHLQQPQVNGPFFTDVADTVQVQLNFRSLASFPLTQIAGEILSPTAVECDETPAEWQLLRTSSDLAYPLGISFDRTGTANWGVDMPLLPPGGIIPTGAETFSESIPAREDSLLEGSESMDVQLKADSLYELTGQTKLELNITDCRPATGLEDFAPRLQCFPNPTTDELQVQFPLLLEQGTLSVLDLQGRMLQSMPLTRSDHAVISLRGLSAGMYGIRVQTTTQSWQTTILKK